VNLASILGYYTHLGPHNLAYTWPNTSGSKRQSTYRNHELGGLMYLPRYWGQIHPTVNTTFLVWTIPLSGTGECSREVLKNHLRVEYRLQAGQCPGVWTSWFERVRGSRKRSEDRERSRDHPPRNCHSMPFNKLLPPPLREDLKTHISGFHPFTPKVMRARLPSKWQWPHMDTYHRTSDLEVHIKSYMTQANHFSEDGRVHCSLFMTTLKGSILEWYYSLLANFVDLFEMLCARFT